jgi:hypothetical protein
MSTREGPQLSRLAPLDETARAPRVKTSVIKQWAGLCPSNGSRTICRNVEDFVRRDPVFSAFRYVRSWVRPTASTRIEATRITSAPWTRLASSRANIIPGDGGGEQVFNPLANGAAIDLRSMQSEPRLGRLVARVALPQDLPRN